MAKYRILIARLAARGEHRAEVCNWIIGCVLEAHHNPLIEDVDHVPIAQLGTDCARNKIVAVARQQRADFVYMVDEDTGPPDGFFLTAFDFLRQHNGPAAIGCPYVCAPPMEDVQVFEWAGAESKTPQTPWAISHVTREEACRRTGIEECDNLGTGCIAYRLDVFEALEKHFGTRVFYSYSYNKDHTEIVETEDTYCHRRCRIAGIPLYVSWNHWARHWKVKCCEKPTRVTQADIDRSYIDRAKAELLAEQREREQKAKAAESAAVGRLATARNGHSPSPPADLQRELCVMMYSSAAGAVGPRPSLDPQEEAFTPAVAAQWAASVEGWMTREELRWLADRASELQPGDRWVEVGTWKGRSLAATFLAAPAGTWITGVDHCLGSPEERETHHAEAGDRLKEALNRTLNELGKLRPGPDPHLGVCLAESVEAARATEPGLAVVFLDAGHDLGSVASDLEAWAPKVRPGGLLCGHDRNEPGVRQALEEWSRSKGGRPVYDEVGTLWYCRMPVQAETPETPAGEGEPCPSRSTL